ncbi:MAG TPA: hypothetical protein VMW89_03065, partial [Desulfatiglandales bacterium]|nr:hypothetical protein [Desulfatiglandales bacterium]
MLRRVPPKDVEVPRACAWGSTAGSFIGFLIRPTGPSTGFNQPNTVKDGHDAASFTDKTDVGVWEVHD